MIQADKIIKGFRVTEKAANLQVANQYTFVVAEDANAIAVSQAVEKAFSVTVERVNIINAKGKVKTSHEQGETRPQRQNEKSRRNAQKGRHDRNGITGDSRKWLLSKEDL